MKNALFIIMAAAGLLALYKAQHVKPVEDPKDSPIFQQRLQSSLDRFQEGDYTPPGSELGAERSAAAETKRSSGAMRASRDLVVSGMCGQATLTWVMEKNIGKETIVVRRRDPGEDYKPLQGVNMYEREEEGGIRYWMSESGLADGVNYDYLVSYKDTLAQEIVKGPASITLTCTERDRELLAQRDKMVKEYYQKKGMEGEVRAAKTPFPQGRTTGGDVIASGRCGRLALTWAVAKMIDKRGVQIKRKAGDGDYSPIAPRTIYHREEASGEIRYWAADEGLRDGERYQYLVLFKDENGNEVVRGPVSIILGCTDEDRALIAEQEKMVREYYRKQKQEGETVPRTAGASPYQLSTDVHAVETEGSPWKGARDAPVTLVVFSDFECLHCATLAATLETMLKTFPQDIRVVFKNYIIPYHKNSERAALAALAAGEQGKFWEMHDLLFKNQQALGEESLINYARKLGLDMDRFAASMAGRELKEKIARDMDQGKRVQIQNLPTTFINGRSLIGSPPPAYIQSLIEGMIKEGMRKRPNTNEY